MTVSLLRRSRRVVVVFGGCCLCLSLCCSVLSCVVWGCFGLARFLLAASPPPARPLGWSLGAWLYLATARLSCLVVWSVVTARLLSSLFFMATKASALWGSALCPLHHFAGVIQKLLCTEWCIHEQGECIVGGQIAIMPPPLQGAALWL